MLTFSNIWRFSQEACDWRTHSRRLKSAPLLDAVFVSNMRDEVDRQRFLGNWKPSSGHFNGPRYHLNGVIAQNRAIDSVTGDLFSSQGRKKAREQFIAATEWARKKGAKVILLAAALKRLFGEDGQALKERFPTLLFTIGDNGTALLLRNEIFHACNAARLIPTSSRIVVLGPYGLLGESVTRALCGGGILLSEPGLVLRDLTEYPKITALKYARRSMG